MSTIEYLKVKSLFFLAENVARILQEKHKKAFQNISKELVDTGYEISY